MKTIEEYAKRGEQHDIVDALKLLLSIDFLTMCGILFGSISKVFWAAEAWQIKLAWQDLPLSEAARKNSLKHFMPYVCDITPYICDIYGAEFYNRGDIANTNKEELLDCCQLIVDEGDYFDEPTTEELCVLFWGLLESLKEKEEFMEIETMAQDGTNLKGRIITQTCGSTLISMESPYHIYASKDELVRDAKELLVESYDDYHRLRNMEKEVRSLYPKYIKELWKCDDKYELRKRQVFNEVYNSIISESVICPIDELFHEWFGLDFYVPTFRLE